MSIKITDDYIRKANNDKKTNRIYSLKTKTYVNRLTNSFFRLKK